MNALRKELESDLGPNSWILDIHNDPFFDFFSEEAHILSSPHVNQAVLLFNTALNFLDRVPEDADRELHVLAGDYLFSKFYMILSRHEEYEVLHDMMEMSKSLNSRKSELATGKVPPDPQEVEWLLYGPMLYLISNRYIDGRLGEVIEASMNNLDITSLPYINQKQG
ncbi:hypothetical protein FO441_04425 [Salinicoccus cyprini]|uniref:Uncharacterized protein n=1 Tax=Salinicoccus cyprini TaxID=2493691 RepID=A0A558AZ27_9STAP|nr:hypothetical protein [Salinicoccus cyprini]TVT29535.1 hypothetical protein FO441_04425 [Salinicoccus cyprini]